MRWWFGVLAGLWLAGCAAPSPEGVTPQTRAERQQQLEQITSWRLKGRVAIINGSEAWHLNVDWRQRHEDYQIELWGPFGSGRVQLEGNNRSVRLINAEQQIYYASDPESLLYEHTGVRMPVSGLRYWILGMTDPQQSRKQAELDRAGRLAAVQQGNWQIAFTRYDRVGDLDLPDRLSVEQHDLLVKLVVDNWQLNNFAP